MNERDAVKEFHEVMGVPVREHPEMPSEAERLLRCRLLLEETLEYIRASGFDVVADYFTGAIVIPDVPVSDPNLAAMAQENADVRYIAHGNDLTMGVDGRVFAEVHRANMDKRQSDGTVLRRADGKVVKPKGWRPPNVAGVLERKP